MSLRTDSPRLLIDEREVDLGTIWIHAQDDPYPGGHCYRFWLPSQIGCAWIAELGLDPTRVYDGLEYLSREGLFWLAGTLLVWRMESKQQSSQPFLFVINTLSHIEPVEQGIEARGICSPFVRNSRE